MLTIAVMNLSTSISDTAVQAMLPPLETQANRDLLPAWGSRQVQFQFVPKGQKPPAGAWWFSFFDTSDQAQALAYHDLTSEGLPLSKIFVKSLEADKASVSVGASHELLEMLVDPWLSGCYQDPHGTYWAAEIADPYEADDLGYQINGVLVSNFALPPWFGIPHPAGAHVDFLGKFTKPFSIAPGGYAQKRHGTGGWIQVTGEVAKSFARAKAPQGSRRDRRAQDHKTWQLSAPDFGAEAAQHG